MKIRKRRNPKNTFEHSSRCRFYLLLLNICLELIKILAYVIVRLCFVIPVCLLFNVIAVHFHYMLPFSLLQSPCKWQFSSMQNYSAFNTQCKQRPLSISSFFDPLWKYIHCSELWTNIEAQLIQISVIDSMRLKYHFSLSLLRFLRLNITIDSSRLFSNNLIKFIHWMDLKAIDLIVLFSKNYLSCWRHLKNWKNEYNVVVVVIVFALLSCVNCFMIKADEITHMWLNVSHLLFDCNDNKINSLSLKRQSLTTIYDIFSHF